SLPTSSGLLITISLFTSFLRSSHHYLSLYLLPQVFSSLSLSLPPSSGLLITISLFTSFLRSSHHSLSLYLFPQVSSSSFSFHLRGPDFCLCQSPVMEARSDQSSTHTPSHTP